MKKRFDPATPEAVGKTREAARTAQFGSFLRPSWVGSEGVGSASSSLSSAPLLRNPYVGCVDAYVASPKVRPYSIFSCASRSYPLVKSSESLRYSPFGNKEGGGYSLVRKINGSKDFTAGNTSGGEGCHSSDWKEPLSALDPVKDQRHVHCWICESVFEAHHDADSRGVFSVLRKKVKQKSPSQVESGDGTEKI